MTRKTVIKTDLLNQLEINGVAGEQYVDLINDYMSMFEIKNKLLADIKKRGVSVEYNNGGNQKGFKKNDSITEMTKVNTQMLRILSDLGLKASELEVVDDDEEM